MSDDDHPTVIAIPDDDQPCSDAECDDNGGSSVLLQEDSPRLQAATDISHPEESSSVSLSPSPLPPAATGTSLPAESSSASPSPSALDVGVLLNFGTIHSLDQAMKLKLIKQTPDTKFKYPIKYIHGCNRRFKPEWVQTHSWLHYSICEDSVYCKACVLFAPTEVKQQQLGLLVTKPFSLWTKQSSVFNNHEKLAYHHDSMARMAAFKEMCSNLSRNVATLLDKAHKEQVSRNAQVIKSLLKCISFCGKQGLSFRGHRDDSTASDSDNLGNFLELVRFRAENDDVLRKYLETSPKNALYTSKTIHNEMISVIGDAIRDEIIDEIQTVKFFSILADEVTDCSTLEQVSIVIRFVDRNKTIREEFLGFIAVERITGEALATALLSWLQEHNIDVSFCRGQGYDGASSMSSSTVGVQARIHTLSESQIEPLHS